MPTFTSVEDAVRALYDGPASMFVATRKTLAAEAKAAGDTAAAREITALRRPTAAAEAVNHLDEDDLQALLRIGTALRAAQTRLDTPELKRLTSERQRLLDAAVAKVDASTSVRDEVRSTLLAATSDAGAEAAVRSRALVRALHYSGWGDVDLADALEQHPAPEQTRRRRPRTPRRRCLPARGAPCHTRPQLDSRPRRAACPDAEGRDTQRPARGRRHNRRPGHGERHLGERRG